VRANWPLIAASLERRGIYDRDVCLGVIPTMAIETASQFAPVREAFWFDEEWRRTHLRYYPFFGRGYLQVTWEANYRAPARRSASIWSATRTWRSIRRSPPTSWRGTGMSGASRARTGRAGTRSLISATSTTGHGCAGWCRAATPASTA
jgi:hypothetical protein